MKQERLWPKVAAVFAVTLAGYLTVYHFIESRRTKHSPWNVSFESDPRGDVTLAIIQQSLNLGPVELHLLGASTNGVLARTNLVFDTPRPFPHPTPVGECVFADLTFLPGTVALRIGGSDIQMLSRILTVGTNEISWKNANGLVIVSNSVLRPRDQAFDK